MGKLKPNGLVVCPECGAVFMNRKNGCCPGCRIPLFYGEEIAYSGANGYKYTSNGWVKLKSL